MRPPVPSTWNVSSRHTSSALLASSLRLEPVIIGWIETKGNLSSLDDKVSVTRAVIRGNESQKKPFDHLGGKGGGGGVWFAWAPSPGFRFGK